MKIIFNIYRILNDYKLYIFVIIFFEIYFYLKNYKGFKINFSSNTKMADNIPCPFFFLFKIKKKLETYKFSSFIDLGCGSGRIIYFFNKSFKIKKIFGIEYFETQYSYCKNIFKQDKNIKIKKTDFSKFTFSKNSFDIYFLSAPFKKSNDFISFMNKLIKIKGNKKKIIVVINYDIQVIKRVKKLKFIETFYLSKEKGYSICSI